MSCYLLVKYSIIDSCMAIIICELALCRFFRIGSIIIALHDASDVFLEAAKVFKYSEKEFGASFCFGLFAISWIVLRLIYFPFWVIRASRFASHIDALLWFQWAYANFSASNCLSDWHFPAMILQNSWIWRITSHCTTSSIPCYWRYLSSTSIGGFSYILWSWNNLKIEEKLEKIYDLVSMGYWDLYISWRKKYVFHALDFLLFLYIVSF